MRQMKETNKPNSLSTDREIGLFVFWQKNP